MVNLSSMSVINYKYKQFYDKSIDFLSNVCYNGGSLKKWATADGTVVKSRIIPNTESIRVALMERQIEVSGRPLYI